VDEDRVAVEDDPDHDDDRLADDVVGRPEETSDALGTPSEGVLAERGRRTVRRSLLVGRVLGHRAGYTPREHQRRREFGVGLFRGLARSVEASPRYRPAAMSGALPTFVIIGAQKCGTTALHAYLARHPQV